MNWRNGVVLAVCCALGATAWWLYRRAAKPPPAFTVAAAHAAPAWTAPGRLPPAPPPDPRYAAEEPSHLADDLNSPAADIRADLRLLNGIFEQYRSSTHGLNPVGDNAEITAALTGRNPVGFAFIPRTCPAINARGELCDRWGTPFFFHQLSGEEMEIRSAGPDRKMWTSDDVVLTPDLP